MSSLVRYYHYTDREISMIPTIYGFDGLTRLYIKLSRLDEIIRVDPPRHDGYEFGEQEKDITWPFRIERQPKFTWAQVDAAVDRAYYEFLTACATS